MIGLYRSLDCIECLPLVSPATSQLSIKLGQTVIAEKKRAHCPARAAKRARYRYSAGRGARSIDQVPRYARAGDVGQVGF